MRETDVHFSAYWVSGMISMIIAVLATTSIIIAISFSPELSVAIAVPIVLIILIALALMIRALRVSMTVQSDAVVVHNLVRSYRLPWASIQGIEVTSGSWIDDGELIEFRLRGSARVLAQASLGRRARRDRILAAMKPIADAWGLSMPPLARSSPDQSRVGSGRL